MKILVVDDDPSARAIITRIMTRQFEQVQIVECHNGLEALERLARDTFAMVLLDLQMPVMDGFDVLEGLRRAPATAPVPVIVMTGVNDETTLRRLLSFGITDCILKPVRPTQLCSRASRLLAKITPERANTQHAAFVPLELTSGTRVLIADGDNEFRQFVRKTQLQKCRVEIAGSGLEAFRRCLEQPPDIVFVGSNLGLVSGEMLARKIRTHNRLTRTRVIGIEPQTTLVQARKRGIYEAVIPRTFVADIFSEALNSLLRRPGSSSDTLTLLPDLKLVAISASEEALSAALKRSVSCKPAVALPSRWTAAAITMQVGRDGTILQVRLSVASKHVATLAERLIEHGAGRQGSGEEPLPRLVTEVARTLASELRGRSLMVVAGDPILQSGAQKKCAAAGPASPDDIAIELEVVGERLSLRLDVGVTATLRDP
jgi:CheY-like chemotaxis protein